MPYSPYPLSTDYELIRHGGEALEALEAILDTNDGDTYDLAEFKLSLNAPARAVVSDDYDHHELEWDGKRWLDWRSGKPFKA